MATRRVLVCFISLFIALHALCAADMVVLTDGTRLEGTLIKYDQTAGLVMMLEHDEHMEFSPAQVASVVTNYQLLGISQPSSQHTLPIIYHAGVNKAFHHVPPRFEFNGRMYDMETGWGMPSDAFEFFIDARNSTTLDAQAIELIDDLERRMIKQNRIMSIGGMLAAAGVLMTWLPINLDDPAATPPLAKGIAIAGFTVNLAGLGMWLSQLFVDNGTYLDQIADAANKR